MFYYELHAHTDAASLCSIAAPEDYIDFYISRGYSGMVVTDHFYHGNTCINRRLPWSEFIDKFCEGYYRAKREGEKKDFVVLFGFEQKFSDGTDEYLVLGISPEWLKAHHEVRDMGRIPFFRLIRESGGYIIQAHPYRERYYISDIRLARELVDAVEVLNVGHEDIYSRRAYEYAKNLGMPMVGGSDIHSIHDGAQVSGVGLERRVESIEDLICELRGGRASICPAERFEAVCAMELSPEPTCPVYVIREDGLIATKNYFCSPKF